VSSGTNHPGIYQKYHKKKSEDSVVQATGMVKTKKMYLSGLVALFLLITPVAADICNPIPDTGFCVVSDKTSSSAYICNTIPNTHFCTVDYSIIDHTYHEIPFKIFFTFNTLRPGYILYAIPGESESYRLEGHTATKIHFIDHAEGATPITDGTVVGKIVVYYQDGTSDRIELIMGENIAEWAYDRHELQSSLAHKKILPAYSFPTNFDSAHNYDAHLFYSSIDTASKPIDRIELQNTDSIWLDIDAITLESEGAADFDTEPVERMTLDPTNYPEGMHTVVTRSDDIGVSVPSAIITTTSPPIASTISPTRQPLSSMTAIIGIMIIGLMYTMRKN
jgi:hypothetical protein